MEMGEVINKENIAIMTVDENELPSIISGQLDLMADLELKMSDALEKAKNVKDSAASAKAKSAGAFKRKEAIEALQSATVDLAEAQSSSMDAQQVFFEYQRQMTEITKYLFGLGCTNISVNRAIIQGLRDGVEGKDSEKFGELAKQHMLTLIKQLKAQEDIQNKTTNLTVHLQEHEQRLDVQEEKLDKQISEQSKKDSQQDKLIEKNRQIGLAQTEEIKKRKQKDQQQDAAIERQIKKDIEHDEQLKIREEKDIEHDHQLVELQNRILQLDERLTEVENKKIQVNLLYVSIAVSTIAIILGVLHFFV